MKKNIFALILLVAISSLSLQAQESDPVIMTINGEDIKKSEFEYIYNKNSQQQIEYKTVDEYIKMFVDYKLKVFEAKANGIDTTASFQKELKGYRNQLAQPYLIDQEADEKLAQEAYDRLKENVEAAHILVTIDENDPTKNKEKAYLKALEIKKRIDSGEDFTKVAKECSEDPSVERNGGYLGYIKGFMTVYPFEQVAYTTEVGTVSNPVLSRYGYHIIKVLSRRPDPGEVLTAHIMVMLPTSVTAEEAEQKEAKIREAYKKLQEGAAFEDVVREYTEDPGTKDTDGKMRWLSAGRIVKEYEDVAFALSEGEISEPFRTPFGWHIVKVIEKRGLKPYDEMRKELLRRVARDNRAGNGRETLIAKLKVEYNYDFDGEKMAQLKELAKTTSLDTNFIKSISADDSKLFTLDGKTYKVSDFAEYYKKNNKGDKTAELEITAKVDEYINSAVIAYENTKLEEKYPDFRNLINEYSDGILLFDISNKEVWDKASKDVKGLKKYFKKNKKEYAWSSPRYKGVVVQCKNDSIANVAKTMLEKIDYEVSATTLNKEINVGGDRVLKAKRGLFEKGDNNIVDFSIFKTGKQPVDEQYPVFFVKGKILKKGPESYLDVKGQVTADYQQQLEKDWIEYLNKKYTVVINKEVVSTIKSK